MRDDDWPEAENDPSDPMLDRGLDAAFKVGGETQSILQRLEAATGTVPRINLRETESQSDTPMLRPIPPGSQQAAGKYVVQGELGRGGVGAVHRGHDQDLGRDVAIKFLHSQYEGRAELIHRFVEEAQIGGQLQHPGIVPVYDMGLSDGRPFFAMKLVKGQTFAKKLAKRLDASEGRQEFLAQFEQVCQTMAYAHARGVVHRDLKPANIMIGSFGEVQVVDWGMGKVLSQGGVADEKLAADRMSQLSVIETVRSSGHGSQSIVGSVMGTPAYMPPEQARGDVDAMDERSDVFALGAILCEILTGQPPYVGEQEELLSMAAMGRLDDARARLAASGAEPELVELAESCLSPAPSARPASAEVVARSMRQHLTSTEARAHDARVEAAEERVRADGLRRSRRLVSLVLLVAVAGLATSLWLWSESRAATRRAETELQRAAEIKNVLSGMLSGVEPRIAKGAETPVLKSILGSVAARLKNGDVGTGQVAAELHAIVGSAYKGLGMRHEARRHLEAAWQFIGELGHPDHPLTVDVEARYGAFLWDTKEVERSVQLLRDVVARSVRVYGPDHANVAFARHNLGHSYKRRGDYEAAGSEYRLALAGFERIGRREQMAHCMSSLAEVHQSQGEPKVARELLERALKLEREYLGDADPATLMTRSRLAGLLRELGDLDQAATIMDGVAERAAEVFGPRHPWTFELRAQHARLLGMRGDAAGYVRITRESLAVMKRTFEPHDKSVLDMQIQLGVGLTDLRRYKEAEEVLRSVLAFVPDSFAPDSDLAMTCTVNLANVLTTTGRPAESVLLLEDLVARLVRVRGEESPFTCNARHSLAQTYADLGRFDEAELVFAKAIEVQTRKFGERSPGLLAVRRDRARVWIAAGRVAEGCAELRAVTDVMREVLGAPSEATMRGVRALGDGLMKLGRLQDAATVWQSALAELRATVGAEHCQTLRLMTNLAQAYMRMRRFADAEPLLAEAVETLQRVHGRDEPFTMIAVRTYAELHRTVGRFDLALPLHEELVAMREQQYGAEHAETLIERCNLVQCMLGMGRFQEIAAEMEAMLPRMRRAVGDSHRYLTYVYGHHASALQGMRRFEEAITLHEANLALRLKLAAKDAVETLGTQTDLGLCYLAVDRPDDAVRMLEPAFADLHRTQGFQHRFTRVAHGSLLQTYGRLGRDHDVERLEKMEFEWLTTQAVDSRAPASLLNQAAWQLLTHRNEQLRDSKRALTFAERAVAGARRQPGPLLGAALDTLARARFDTGDVAGAIEAQQEAVERIPVQQRAEAEATLKRYRAALDR